MGICFEYLGRVCSGNMIWFFLGFLFGVFVSQESPNFPNIKTNSLRMTNFIKEILANEPEKTNKKE